jgi:hypothetical protein
MKRRCLKCGAEWEIKGPVGFREECPECAAFVHTCANCALYDPAGRRCTSPTTEPVRDSHEMNFCEEFEYGAPGTGPAPGKGPPAARTGPGVPPGKPADKGADKPISADEARRRFENLFREPKK